MCCTPYSGPWRLLLKYTRRREKWIFFLLLTFLTTWKFFSPHHRIFHRTNCYWASPENHSVQNSMEDKGETLWIRHVIRHAPALKQHLRDFCAASHFMLFFLHNWALMPVEWLQQCQAVHFLLCFSKKTEGDAGHIKFWPQCSQSDFWFIPLQCQDFSPVCSDVILKPEPVDVTLKWNTFAPTAK